MCHLSFNACCFGVENRAALGCAAGQELPDDRNANAQSAQHADGHRIADLLARVVAIARAFVDMRGAEQLLFVVVTQRFDGKAACAREAPDRHHDGGNSS